MKVRWDRFGARLGLGVCVAGFVLIFIGWNGAASVDRLPSQFPYLISGGLAGLALVVIGASLIIVETSRGERDKLREEIAALRTAIEGMSARSTNGARAKAEETKRGPFVAGQLTFHRPDCRLLEGRGDLPRVTLEAAAEHRLAACRVCEPTAARRR